MKKIFILFISLIIVFSLVGCTKVKDNNIDTTSGATS
jgi:predicted small lipoprotein YifL